MRIQGLLRRRQVRRGAAFIADVGVVAGLFQFGAQGVEISSRSAAVGERRGATA